MFNNDYYKKYSLWAAVLSLMLLVLVSCGKHMRTDLEGSAHDVALRIYEEAGENTAMAYEEIVNAENAYIFGISEEDFREKIAEATVFHPSELSGGRTLCVIVSKDEATAKELYARLYDEYDWAPCDPSDSMAFMRFGKYIVTVKDGREETAKLCRAFSAISDGGATVRFSDNPM